MFRKKSELKRGVEIDLTGPEGNAYCILAAAKDLANQLDRDPDEILARMKESDYENLIAVFEQEFGEFVTLYR